MDDFLPDKVRCFMNAATSFWSSFDKVFRAQPEGIWHNLNEYHKDRAIKAPDDSILACASQLQGFCTVHRILPSTYGDSAIRDAIAQAQSLTELDPVSLIELEDNQVKALIELLDTLLDSPNFTEFAEWHRLRKLDNQFVPEPPNKKAKARRTDQELPSALWALRDLRLEDISRNAPECKLMEAVRDLMLYSEGLSDNLDTRLKPCAALFCLARFISNLARPLNN
jgi:hypothetical protein